MATANINMNWQVTIPTDIREHLNLNVGDRLEFLIEPNGKVYFMSQTEGVETLKTLLKKPDKSVSIETMHAAISKRMDQKR